MPNLFDDSIDELVAKGGSFDITGTTAVTDKQFWSFNASDGAVLEVIKGIPLKSTASTLAQITAAEVDISGYFLTTLTDPLFANVVYRADGYIITNIKLTSGSLHCYKKMDQISA